MLEFRGRTGGLGRRVRVGVLGFRLGCCEFKALRCWVCLGSRVEGFLTGENKHCKPGIQSPSKLKVGKKLRRNLV